VNDVRVKRLTYHRLRHMDVIRVGRSSRSFRMELHEKEVAAPSEVAKVLCRSLSSSPRSINLTKSSSPVSQRLLQPESGTPSAPPIPTVPLSKRSPSVSPEYRKRTITLISTPTSRPQFSTPSPHCKRMKMNKSLKSSGSRSPNIQPMTKAYEKAVIEEELLFLRLETIKQRLHLLEIVRAEKRSESKKDLADMLKFDDSDESPRRSSTLNEYLESFALEFLPNFLQASADLIAEKDVLKSKWEAARIEVKKLRPPLIPADIPVLCVSPRSKSTSREVPSDFPRFSPLPAPTSKTLKN